MQNFKSFCPLGPELKAPPLSENLDFALLFLLDNRWTFKMTIWNYKKLQLLENYEKNNFYHSKKMHEKSEYG